MKLRLHIKNFGKIKKADIAINNLTVFGGTNNIGKSYVSRALYAILDSMNANHTEEYFKSLLVNFNEKVEILSVNTSINFDGETSSEFENKLESIKNMLRELVKNSSDLQTKPLKIGTDDEFYAMGSSIISLTQELVSILDKFNDESKPLTNKQYSLSIRDNTYLAYVTESIKEALNEFEKAINASDEEILQQSYREILTQNFLHNFQIKGLNELIGKKESASAEITIKAENDISLIGISMLPEGELKLDIPGPDNLKYLEEFSRVVYLESPMYWKLESPLMRSTTSGIRRFITDSPKETLTGVPKYFNDAYDGMTVRRTGKPFIEHDIEKIIGGKIIRNERNELVFVEKGAKRAISLPLTASGVIQLGMLGHLIETRVIQEGSILFIDEPEAHLHPDWQQRIIEVLYKLSEAGVMVIIATHSPVIMEWITVQVKEKPESKEIIALNSFHKDAEFDCIKKGYEGNMDEIIEDLTEPFSRLYIRQL